MTTVFLDKKYYSSSGPAPVQVQVGITASRAACTLAACPYTYMLHGSGTCVAAGYSTACSISSQVGGTSIDKGRRVLGHVAMSHLAARVLYRPPPGRFLKCWQGPMGSGGWLHD